jgi:hypothetical protein
MPFSASQVLIVRPTQTIPSGLSPPLSFDSWYILKIYDPRYVVCRERRYSRRDGTLLQDEQLWSLEAELKAATCHHALGLQIWEDDARLNCSEDLEPEAVGELMYYRMAKWVWEDEVDAYQVLNKTSLAGWMYPVFNFYGAGDLDLEEESRGIVRRLWWLSILKMQCPCMTSNVATT